MVRFVPGLLRRARPVMLFACVAVAAETTAVDESARTLPLAECFDRARENNARLRASMSRVEETRGREIAARSRLLPQLGAVYRGGVRGADSGAAGGDEMRVSDDQALDLELRQRLLEFGKTTEEELERIRQRRASLYASEDRTVETLSAIRKTYFALRIIQDQLRKHDSLLTIYTKQLDNARERFSSGVSLKTQVLAARLNRLEEKERILGLRERERERLAELTELTGMSRRIGAAVLTDTIVPLAIGEDSCVVAALRHSTAVADAEQEAELARRMLREWGWELAPEVTLSAGVRHETHELALELGGGEQGDVRKTWGLDLVGTERLVAAGDSIMGSERLFGTTLFPRQDSTLRYTLKVMVRFPLFKGLKRRGTRIEAGARYERARREAIARTHETEKRTRIAYARYETSRGILEVWRERVAIDRERYSLAVTQHELGRMSDEGLDAFRERLFRSQDAYFAKQFDVLEKEEELRRLTRMLE